MGENESVIETLCLDEKRRRERLYFYDGNVLLRIKTTFLSINCKVTFSIYSFFFWIVLTEASGSTSRNKEKLIFPLTPIILQFSTTHSDH